MKEVKLEIGYWVHFLVPFLRAIGNSKLSKDGSGSLAVVFGWILFVPLKIKEKKNESEVQYLLLVQSLRPALEQEVVVFSLNRIATAQQFPLGHFQKIN